MKRELWLSMDINDKFIHNQIENVQIKAKQLVTGDWINSSSAHITIEYLSDSEENYKPIVNAMHKLVKHTRPCNLQSSYLGKFDSNVLWLGIDNSWELYRIKYIMKQLLEQENWQFKKSKFKGYSPHITLAYNCKEIPNITVPKFTIPFNNITLWNSFKINGEYVDNILYSILI